MDDERVDGGGKWNGEVAAVLGGQLTAQTKAKCGRSYEDTANNRQITCPQPSQTHKSHRHTSHTHRHRQGDRQNWMMSGGGVDPEAKRLFVRACGLAFDDWDVVHKAREQQWGDEYTDEKIDWMKEIVAEWFFEIPGGASTNQCVCVPCPPSPTTSLSFLLLPSPSSWLRPALPPSCARKSSYLSPFWSNVMSLS